MARLAGKSGTVTLGGTAILGVKSWNVTAEADIEDITGMDFAGVAQYGATITRWSGTVECWLDSTQTAILDTINEGTLVDVELSDGAGGITMSGTAVVKSIKPTVEVTGHVKMTLDVQGTDELTTS